MSSSMGVSHYCFVAGIKLVCWASFYRLTVWLLGHDSKSRANTQQLKHQVEMKHDATPGRTSTLDKVRVKEAANTMTV